MVAMKETVDVCVVGGGVVGLYAGCELARRGKSVRVIDKKFIGSSRHNIGSVLLQGHHAAELPFIKSSQEIWQQAGEEWGEDFGYEERGSVYFALSEAETSRLQKEVERDTAQGFSCRYEDDLTALAKDLGDVRLGEQVLGAKISENDGIIETGRALDGLRRQLIKHGARIWGSDEVTDFIIEDGKIMGARTADGDECHAGITLMVAGVWSNPLLKHKMNIHVPMRPARCHILQVSPNGTMPMQMVARKLAYGELVAKYQRSGRVLVSYNGLMDQAQATWSTQADIDAVNWMQARAPELLGPLQHATVHQQSVVSIAVTPDFLPCVGFMPQLENLYVAVGFNGKSYAYAAALSKVIAAQLDGEEPPVDISAFKPDRFIDGSWKKSASE